MHDVELHDYVALVRKVERFPVGTRGTVVALHPEDRLFTVEVSDDEGRTLDLLPVRRMDIELLEAVGDTRRVAEMRPRAGRVALRSGKLGPSSGMTKQEFVDRIASKTDLSRKDAAKAVDAFLETVTETLKSGQDVAFTGFGKFSTQRRAARQGVNPRNPSQKVTIPAATVPKFSAGSSLKSAIR
jgi:DNA-binding protein HU-beta